MNVMEQMLFFELCDDDDQEDCERGLWSCQDCGEDLLLNDNYKVCPRCGLCADREFVSVSYDKPMINKRSVYKQINHFKYILSTVQNQESKTVPTDVVERLEEHLENQEISLDNIRRKLKLMGESKYYKHSVQLWCHLKGVTVFKCLSPAEEDRVIELFKRLQRCYRSLQGLKRKNFLNYNYLTSKLLMKVGREDLAQLCKPLKNAALRNHNRIWKKLQEMDANL